MSDRVGEQLGNYRITELLGEGGFAEVYLGEHIHLGTQAAIKVLHTRLTRDELEGFRNEARTVARLEHPNIVRVLEFGLESGTPFLIMNYAPNGSLRQRHPKGIPLPLPTIVSYVKQVADALQYAHDEKVIHRDVKPENMLVGRRNEVLLSDFGIALIAQSTSSQSKQEVIGTVMYMAPEQVRGKPRPASDQYALGIVVYEWLCGYRPFYGSFTEIATQHLFEPPPPLREKNPTISPAIEQIVMTALAKDPHRRFANVQAFATALEEACSPIQHHPIVSPSRPLEPTIAVIPPTQHAWSAIADYSSISEPPIPPDKTSVPLSKPQLAEQAISRRMMVTGIIGLAAIGVVGSVTWLAHSHFPSGPISQPTSTTSPIHTITSNSSPVSTPSPSSPPIGTVLHTFHVHPYGGPVVWSPKNQRIAYGNSYGVEVWDVDTGNHIYTYLGYSGDVTNCLAWSPGGTRIASGTGKTGVHVWNATTGEHILTYSRHTFFLTSVAWSPDSKLIASASADHTVQVWDAATGSQLLVYNGHSSEVTSVSWSPDGKQIASASFDHTAQIWDATTGTPIRTYTGHSDRIWALAWSPNSTHIASGSFDGIIEVWDATTGNQLIAYKGHLRQGQYSQINAISWSPDGKRIASTAYDQTVQIWDATYGNNIYEGFLSQASGIAWSPEGTRLACGTYSIGILEVLQAA